MRKIVVNGVEYQYRIGEQNAVIRLPNGKAHIAPLSEIKGLSQDLIDRGRWKVTSDGMIKPREVRNYIAKFSESFNN